MSFFWWFSGMTGGDPIMDLGDVFSRRVGPF